MSFLDRFKGKTSVMNKDGIIGMVKSSAQPVQKVHLNQDQSNTKRSNTIDNSIKNRPNCNKHYQYNTQQQSEKSNQKSNHRKNTYDSNVTSNQGETPRQQYDYNEEKLNSMPNLSRQSENIKSKTQASLESNKHQNHYNMFSRHESVVNSLKNSSVLQQNDFKGSFVKPNDYSGQFSKQDYKGSFINISDIPRDYELIAVPKMALENKSFAQNVYSMQRDYDKKPLSQQQVYMSKSSVFNYPRLIPMSPDTRIMGATGYERYQNNNYGGQKQKSSFLNSAMNVLNNQDSNNKNQLHYQLDQLEEKHKEIIKHLDKIREKRSNKNDNK